VTILKKSSTVITTLVLGTVLLSACGGGGDNPPVGAGGGGTAEKLTGTVSIDGSSTVFPITEAVAEEFQAANPGVKITVGVSGTSGGFKRFIPGEVDINNASRKIKDKEIELIQKNGFEAIEVPVAYDGLSIVVNPTNDFVDYLTVDELKKIWEPNSQVKLWSEVRAGWPAKEIKLYGPGTDSGTFGYFTEAVVGEEGASRSDYTASEDDHVLVQGVAGDDYALGYFGFAYYEENKDKIKAVPIKATPEAPAILPTMETINDGSYTPFSRFLFIYVSSKSMAEKPEVKTFVNYYLDNAAVLAEAVGYVPLSEADYQKAKSLVQ
jgi:phosphate transport system substrate-binding protein